MLLRSSFEENILKVKEIEKLPPTPEELIGMLDEMIPEQCPRLSQSEREIFMYAGKRQLVVYLKGLVDQP